MTKKGQKILVGMSGGVDSSVAVLLLQKEGYEVEGVFIDFVGGEKSEKDFASAQKIAEKLKITLDKIDARKIFKKEIIDKFVADYEKGVTPNPCVICNPEMKFRILIEEANKRVINLVSTGHYARIISNSPNSSNSPNKIQNSNSKLEIEESYQSSVIGHRLFVAKDESKDQSYFLYRLSQKQLARIIFPLGECFKSEVREIAKENNFEIKSEEESQDVCFVAGNDFQKFIAEKLKKNPGKIVDTKGNILGAHEGLHFYTIGQRKGINLGGDGPYYVMRKDIKKNELVVSNVEKDLESSQRIFHIRETSWINPDQKFPLVCLARVRYHGKVQEVKVALGTDGECEVKMTHRERAVTPGQSAVFYSNEGEVLGGGIII